MEWTEETIARLRSLWQEGLSTAEIGRRMSITKNAVVGKAHRLTLPPRPSPIRKGLVAGASEAQRAPRREANRSERPAAEASPEGAGSSARITRLVPRSQGPVADPTASENALSSQPVEAETANITALHVVARAPTPRGPAMSSSEPTVPAADLSADGDLDDRRNPAGTLQAASRPAPRHRGQSCCWPLGEPGTKQFRFCGGEPMPGKPYCSEHAQLAYVKLRDRRDTVA